jgi:hypothetical protein
MKKSASIVPKTMEEPPEGEAHVHVTQYRTFKYPLVQEALHEISFMLCMKGDQKPLCRAACLTATGYGTVLAL